MNMGITKGNKFIADTNDSENWDTIIIPLPRKLFGKWRITGADSNGSIDLT